MEETYLNLSEASRTAKVAKSTISRAIKTGKLPNHQQQPDGSYRIPLSDLIAAGYLDTVKPTKTAPEVAPIAQTTSNEALELQHQLELAQQELRFEKEKTQQLERVIATQKEALEAYRLSLKALESTPAKQPAEAKESATESPVQQQKPEPATLEQEKTTAIRQWFTKWF